MVDSAPLLAAGGISLILGGLLIYYYLSAKRLLDEMWAVNTYGAKELKRLCSGDFDVVAEVQGTLDCDQPLIAQGTGAPCCWLRITVQRERIVANRNRREDRWQTEYSSTRTAVFKVRDNTGYTLVDPTNADIDTQTSSCIIHERPFWFEAENIGYSETGRYRIEEEFLAVGEFVYVLGQASCAGIDKDVIIHYPQKGHLEPGNKFFLISRKNERELAKSKGIATTLCFWFSIVAFLAAAYSFLLAFR